MHLCQVREQDVPPAEQLLAGVAPVPLALVCRQVPQQARGVAEPLLAAGGGAVVQQGGGVAAEGGRGEEGLEFAKFKLIYIWWKRKGNYFVFKGFFSAIFGRSTSKLSYVLRSITSFLLQETGYMEKSLSSYIPHPPLPHSSSDPPCDKDPGAAAAAPW